MARYRCLVCVDKNSGRTTTMHVEASYDGDVRPLVDGQYFPGALRSYWRVSD